MILPTMMTDTVPVASCPRGIFKTKQTLAEFNRLTFLKNPKNNHQIACEA